MRKILFILVFLSSLCSFSQVRDDFSDGDFVSDPLWDGDMGRFIVNKDGQLRLNDSSKKEGISYLSTSSSLLKETTWEFYVHLYFNPSANNFARFYLAADSPVLSGVLNGYYVAIGGANDNVSLCFQEGEQCYELIEGVEKMKGLSSPQLCIKVHCDAEGNWKLWTCVLNTEEAYSLEGSVKDKRLEDVSTAGIYCHYTASHGKSFAFDDIVIKQDTPEEDPPFPDVPPDPAEPDDTEIPNPDNDNVPPHLLSLYASSDTTLYIGFDEPVDIRQAIFIIDKEHVCISKELSSDQKSITVIFSGLMENNHSYFIEITGVKDIYGNEMIAAGIGFVYYDLTMHPALWGDVIFNEVMAHPSALNGLPEVEYVELYNRKETPLSLKGWTFYYGDKGYSFPDAMILPRSYVILCAEKWIKEWEKREIPVVGLSSFPALADGGKLVYLKDARNQLISFVHYSDEWYRDAFKKQGGFSLECIDSDNLSGSAENWAACIAPEGGTPSQTNSVHASHLDQTTPEIVYACMQSADTLMVFFSKPMQLSLLRSVQEYKVVSPISIQVTTALPGYPEGKQVKLALSRPLEKEEEVEVQMASLADLSGMELSEDFIVKAGLPQQACKGEVILNEILFNPRTGGSDYVELYNGSGHYIGLNSLCFSTFDNAGVQTEGIPLAKDQRTFPPYSYICFTKNVKGVFEQYACSKKHLIELAAFPSLPDDKGNILLLSASGEQIDQFFYSEKMHSAFLNDKEGVALEKCYPAPSSSTFSHWLSASSACGGGTPGFQNSQYREPDSADEETFQLERRYFSPDNDGNDDVLVILYRFANENYLADIKVYGDTGQLICTLAQRCRLASEGSLIWDGRDNSGALVSAGLYIIYIEAYRPQGDIRHFKLVCALTR